MKKIKKQHEGESYLSSRLDVGITVRRLREAKGLSGVELCRRARGFDPRTLTALEKGRIKNPSIATLLALGKGLGMTVSDLFRQAELGQQDYFSLGSQKGLAKIDFPGQGVQLISFTPLVGDFFCGKMIVEGQKGFDEKLLKHSGSFFIMTIIGQFEGVFEGKKVLLKEGENLFFRGNLKFKISNALQRSSTLFLVTTPSCFRAQE